MKYLILSFLILFSVSCGEKEIPYLDSAQPGQESKLHLKHKKLKELFIVIFERNYSPEEWEEIFDLTNILSANKKTLRKIEGETSDEAALIRSPLIKKNAEVLTVLIEKSIFMLSWSAQDENCKIIETDQILFSCKPRNENNPLNGGLPKIMSPLKWITPNPVVSDVKVSFLKFLMQKNATRENSSSYELELRLKEESISESESWFKGDAIPAQESIFIKSDGTKVSEFFKFGYAEMTLGN